ncbi:hypothetical protein OHB41_25725 [Streptomyces sp. NBC_01571]|uniref:hypothetical protein n=1 Tax=Streptomyces sp. NBC_01571 TaxID=2975883 RepID=UPI00225A0DCF|nr:hypothetical protein [Streptomyces sp. NBC_01571]MCX4576510.1 hypothetical protein [Streptomyces sp. NBC_01571]
MTMILRAAWGGPPKVGGSMRKRLAVSIGITAVLLSGCSDGPKDEDKSLDQLKAERDARESADPSLKDVRVCTALVTARIVTGWRQAINAGIGDESSQLAREFDKTYLPGSPEYDSFIQRFQEGVPVLTKEIALKKRDREEVLIEQTAEVSKFVKQDCTVAYKK